VFKDTFGALTLLVWWQEGQPACKKLEWWDAGVVICLERGADLHMAQLMPLPLTVSCFSKIQIGITFLVPAHPGSPRQTAVKRMCVCVCVCVQTECMLVGRASGLLLASDVAARGLDITGVEHVIHYQVPRTTEVCHHWHCLSVCLSVCPSHHSATARPCVGFAGNID